MLRFALLIAFASPVFAQLPKDHPDRNGLLAQATRCTERAEKAARVGEFAAAIAALEERLAIEKKIYGENGATLETTMNSMAYYAMELKDFAQAAKHWKAQTEMSEKRNGAKHWRTLTARSMAEQAGAIAKLDEAALADWLALGKSVDRASALQREGKFAEAVKLLEQAAADSKRLIGENTPQRLQILQNLAYASFRIGRREAAVQIFESLVAVDEKIYPQGHPHTTENTHSLGVIYHLTGQFKKAEPLLLRTLNEVKVFVKEGGMIPRNQIAFLRDLTKFYIDAGNLGGSKKSSSEALVYAVAAFGKESDAYRYCLIDVANVAKLETKFHLDFGNITDAKKSSLEALEYAGAAFGKESEAYLYALGDAAKAALNELDFAKAEPWLATAYDLAGKLAGKKSPMQAEFLFRQGDLHFQMGRFREAREEVERAIEWTEKSPKPNMQTLAECRKVLAGILVAVGDPRGAVELYRILLAAREKEFGVDSLPTVILHIDLGRALLNAGDFPVAEAAIKKGCEIAQKNDPTDGGGAYTATAHLSMATLYTSVGDFRQAESAIVKARVILVKLFGEKHAMLATADGVLGLVYYSTGDYRRAELLLRQAVEVNRKAYGDHLITAKALTNLGKYYVSLGNYAKATEALLDSIRILKAKIPGGNQIFDELLYLGQVSKDTDKFEDAERYFAEAIAIAEGAGATWKGSLALALTHHSNALVQMKKWDEALAELSRAEAIWIDLQKANPDKKLTVFASITFHSLAFLHCKFDRMAEAERAMAKSTEIVKASGVTDAGLMSFIKLSNARFHIINDRPVEAAKAIDECIAYNREKYSQILGFTSEEEMFDASIDYRNAVALRLYIALRNPVEAQNAEGAYLTLVHKNGLILDAMCQYRELERSAKPDAELAANVREYRAMKQRLANATLNPQAGEKPAELKAMEEKAALMQSKIHRRFSDTHLPAYGRMELADIRAKIPAGSALVEFVHLDLYMINRGERALSTIRQYAAFVITADAKEPIRLIDLGKGEAIEDAIKSLGGELQTFAPEEEGRKERQFKRAAAKLHQLLIAPLEPALKGANSLIISPDGAINHVPFAALVNAEGKYLIETHRLRLVTGGRDLLRLPAKEKGAGVAVFADPDYDASFSKPGTSEPFTGGWKKLAHTREEANAIGASLKGGQFGDVRLFLGKDASEEGVKQLHSPRILHLATHGTFVQRSKSFTEADLRSSSTRQMAAANPLLRSAIILAGANKVAPAGQIVDDGILTADEVAFLDLGGTELVVLSACESGLGDLASGEGVQGLRRAFLYAGARSVVATLYPVPDKETAQLMKAFYGELAAGKGKLESLHAAQLKMLQARRGEGNLQPAHPLYWAAFVLIGEDR